MTAFDGEPSNPTAVFYEIENSECEGPLLLPEESCLTEGENATLEIRCKRPGFHLFRMRDFTLKDVLVIVYLTNYRVRNVHSIESSD